MSCKSCQAPDREIWPPSRGPELASTGLGGNFMGLDSCPTCSQLWVVVGHEPYASFPYSVKWPFTENDFVELFQRDMGNALHDWHQAEINRLGPSLVGGDSAAIQAHSARSGGLEPYNNHRELITPNLKALLGRA